MHGVGFDDRAEFSLHKIRNGLQIALFHLLHFFAFPADEMVMMSRAGKMAEAIVELTVFRGDADHETDLFELFKDAVDGWEPDRGELFLYFFMDLVRGFARVLFVKKIQHGFPLRSDLKTVRSELAEIGVHRCASTGLKQS